jgi:acyl dehydratase
MGQFQAGLLSRLAADWFGIENVRRYRVRFKAKVWPGDVLVLRGREVARDGGVVECELEAVREHNGEVAVQAWLDAVA